MFHVLLSKLSYKVTFKVSKICTVKHKISTVYILYHQSKYLNKQTKATKVNICINYDTEK